MGDSGEYMASNVWRLNSELYYFLARIDPPLSDGKAPDVLGDML